MKQKSYCCSFDAPEMSSLLCATSGNTLTVCVSNVHKTHLADSGGGAEHKQRSSTVLYIKAWMWNFLMNSFFWFFTFINIVKDLLLSKKVPETETRCVARGQIFKVRALSLMKVHA